MSPREWIDEIREELERCKYVPGQLRCKKCGCSVVSRILSMKSGTVGIDSKPKDCPNGCGPMWKISWPDHFKDYAKGMDKILDKERAKSKKLDEEVQIARDRLGPAGWKMLLDQSKNLQLANCPIHDTFAKKCRTCWQVSADWNVPANE